MSANAIVAASFDGAYVFKDHVAAVAVDVKAVVAGMRGGEILDYEVSIVAAELHARLRTDTKMFASVSLCPGFSLMKKVP